MPVSMKEFDRHDIHRLIEECSEVQKVACKILRFGTGFVNPETNERNDDELMKECGDLLYCIQKLFDTKTREFQYHVEAKEKKVSEWSKKEMRP